MPLAAALIIIPFFGFFLLLIFGFLALVVFLIKKGRDLAWNGTVIDKVHNQKRVERHKIVDYYFLVVDTVGGRRRNVGLSREMYDKFNIGDKIKKEKGKLYPEIA